MFGLRSRQDAVPIADLAPASLLSVKHCQLSSSSFVGDGVCVCVYFNANRVSVHWDFKRSLL